MPHPAGALCRTGRVASTSGGAVRGPAAIRRGGHVAQESNRGRHARPPDPARLSAARTEAAGAARPAGGDRSQARRVDGRGGREEGKVQRLLEREEPETEPTEPDSNEQRDEHPCLQAPAGTHEVLPPTTPLLQTPAEGDGRGPSGGSGPRSGRDGDRAGESPAREAGERAPGAVRRARAPRAARLAPDECCDARRQGPARAGVKGGSAGEPRGPRGDCRRSNGAGGPLRPRAGRAAPDVGRKRHRRTARERAGPPSAARRAGATCENVQARVRLGRGTKKP